MRLGDLDELKKCAIPCEIHNGALTDLCVPLYQIDNAPTIKTFTLLDIEEQYLKGLNKGLESWETQRPKGEWEYNQYDSNIGNWHCSECRKIIIGGITQKPTDNFCPNCGADMRKGDAE